MSQDSQEILATGRRKTAVASVRLRKGEGNIEINGKSFEEFFPTETLQSIVLQPLQTTENIKSFDIRIRAQGGGPVGQAGAARLGIARALLKINEEYREGLRAEGLLTRDPRMRERKKSGQPGARKRFQFSKR